MTLEFTEMTGTSILFCKIFTRRWPVTKGYATVFVLRIEQNFNIQMNHRKHWWRRLCVQMTFTSGRYFWLNKLQTSNKQLTEKMQVAPVLCPLPRYMLKVSGYPRHRWWWRNRGQVKTQCACQWSWSDFLWRLLSTYFLFALEIWIFHEEF